MTKQYIVKSYGEDLKNLTNLLVDMGELVKKSIEKAIIVLETGDKQLAQSVMEGDAVIDRLENEIDNFSVRILALRQPVAQDLRQVVASLKISSHLERIADYAEHIAKRQSSLDTNYKIHHLQTLFDMGNIITGMLSEILKAFENQDDAKANEVWEKDDEVDDLYLKFITDQLAYIAENPKDTNNSIHLMIMCKNLERIADHITNIAENIHYLVHGTLWSEAHSKRPRT